jgi:hypothetical protein
MDQWCDGGKSRCVNVSLDWSGMLSGSNGGDSGLGCVCCISTCCAYRYKYLRTLQIEVTVMHHTRVYHTHISQARIAIRYRIRDCMETSQKDKGRIACEHRKWISQARSAGLYRKHISQVRSAAEYRKLVSQGRSAGAYRKHSAQVNIAGTYMAHDI